MNVIALPRELTVLLKVFALRELRDKRNAWLLVGLIVLAAMYGDAEGVRARVLSETPRFDVQRLKGAAVFLTIVFACMFARRIQTDRLDGWLSSAVTSGAIRPVHYLLSVSTVSLVCGLLFLVVSAVAVLSAWAHSANASAVAGFAVVPPILLFWMSCLAFAVAVAAWQRDVLGLLGAAVMLILVPFLGTAIWVVRHDRYLPQVARRIVFIFSPPGTMSLAAGIVLHHVIYTGAMLLIAMMGAVRTLRRSE